MLNRITQWIKYPFIYAWNSFVAATFDGNLHIDDHPKGGTRVWQDHKLFGIKFTITIVKQIPQTPEEVEQILESLFKEFNQNHDNKLVMIPLGPEVNPFSLSQKKKPTKKKVAKKKAKPKKKSKK